MSALSSALGGSSKKSLSTWLATGSTTTVEALLVDVVAWRLGDSRAAVRGPNLLSCGGVGSGLEMLTVIGLLAPSSGPRPFNRPAAPTVAFGGTGDFKEEFDLSSSRLCSTWGFFVIGAGCCIVSCSIARFPALDIVVASGRPRSEAT